MSVLIKDKLNIISKILLTLILITLPLGFAVNSISIFLFFLFGCYKVVTLKEIEVVNRLVLLLVSFYILCLLSLLWSDNLSTTLTGLTRFLPYIILPIAFIFNNISTKKCGEIFNLFSKSLVFYSLYCLIFGVINTYKHTDINYMFYHNLSNNLTNMNAIYLSVLVSFGIGLLFNKRNKSKLDFFCLVILAFFLILLSSKIIITFTFLFLVIVFLKKRKFKALNHKSLIIVFGLFLGFLVASTNVIDRVKEEFNKTNIEEVLHKKEFGHVYLWTGAGLRLFQLRVFFETMTKQNKYLFGFGLNNSQDSLNKKYLEYNLYPGFFNYNYHNQYVQVLAELGVFGLSLILLMLYFLIKKSIVYEDFNLLYFIILIITVCFTESFLWRQRGMVFFITTALLFLKKSKIEKKEIHIN